MYTKEQLKQKRLQMLKKIQPTVETNISDAESMMSHQEIEFYNGQEIDIPIQDYQNVTSFNSIS